MNTFFKKGVLFIVLLYVGFILSGQAGIDQLFEEVRKEFKGSNAHQTTEYVSEFWRLPGNPGFDSSIHYVKNILERAGFVEEGKNSAARLTYRIESRPLRYPAWHPVDADLTVAGDRQPLLGFATNRNMMAINSFSTPDDGVEAELVFVDACDAETIHKKDIRGKIVMAECHSFQLYKAAVEKGGAVGVLAYRIPDYNQPEKNSRSIPFTGIPFNSKQKSWAINLSYEARETLKARLADGRVKVRVNLQTTFIPAEELTLIAEIKGSTRPDQRFVFSAHVQEPGANDNASGVGALAEMARTAAALYQDEWMRPERTITFLWGDEISSTRRFIQEDEERAKGILWGVSLDMVGEDTRKTGGTFLIEKMPDPSAIWTRGEDKHTEWGAAEVTRKQLNPHYFNDLIIHICQEQGRYAGWEVGQNPFEGGSDHQPFLNAGKPGLLLWHFTDMYYHTDADRIDKVSPQTLHNVGVSALVSAFLLANGGEKTSRTVLDITERAALTRLETEYELSRKAVQVGGSKEKEKEILRAWGHWYSESILRIDDVVLGQPSAALAEKLKSSAGMIRTKTEDYLTKL